MVDMATLFHIFLHFMQRHRDLCQLYLPWAHQTRRSGQNSRTILAEVTLPQLQNEIEIEVTPFLETSSFYGKSD